MEENSVLTDIGHIAPMVIEPTSEYNIPEVSDTQTSSRNNASEAIASGSIAQPGMVYQMINMNVNGVVKNLMVPVQAELKNGGSVPGTDNLTRINIVKSNVPLVNPKSTGVSLPGTSTIIVKTVKPTTSTQTIANNVPSVQTRGTIIVQKPPQTISGTRNPTTVISGTRNQSSVIRLVCPTQSSSVRNPSPNEGMKTVILPTMQNSGISGLNVFNQSLLKTNLNLNARANLNVLGNKPVSQSLVLTNPKSVTKKSNPPSVTITPSSDKTVKINPSGGIEFTSDKKIQGISIDTSEFAPVLTLTPEANKKLLADTKRGKQIFVEFSNYKSAKGKTCAVVFSCQRDVLKSYLIELDNDSGILSQLTSTQNGLSALESESTKGENIPPIKAPSLLSTSSTLVTESERKSLKISSVYSQAKTKNDVYPVGLVANRTINENSFKSNKSPQFKQILKQVIKSESVIDSDNIMVDEGVSDDLMETEDEDYKVLAEWNPDEYDDMDMIDDDYDPRFNRIIHDPYVRPKYGLPGNLKSPSSLKENITEKTSPQKQPSSSPENTKTDRKRKHSPFNPCTYYGCIGCNIPPRGPKKVKFKGLSRYKLKKNKAIKLMNEEIRKKLFDQYRNNFPMLKECDMILHKLEPPVGLDPYKWTVTRRQVAKKSTTKPPRKSQKAISDFKCLTEIKCEIRNPMNKTMSQNELKSQPSNTSSVTTPTTQASGSNKSKYLMVKTNAGTFLVPTNNTEPAMVLNYNSSSGDGTITANVINKSPTPSVETTSSKTERQIKITPRLDKPTGLDKLIKGKPEDAKVVGKLIQNIMENKATDETVNDGNVSNSHTDTDDNVDSDNSLRESSKTESSRDRIKRLKEKLKAQHKDMENAKKAVENSKNVLKTIDLD